MPPVLCHPNRYLTAAPGISHVPAAVFGGNRYGLYHRNLCHYHLLCRLHHRKTGRQPQIPLGPACRKHLLYHPVDSVHGDENARRSVYYAHADRARALCRRRHVGRDVKLNQPFLPGAAFRENGSFCFLTNSKGQPGIPHIQRKILLPLLFFFNNNPPVVGYFPVVARLLPGYFKT